MNRWIFPLVLALALGACSENEPTTTAPVEASTADPQAAAPGTPEAPLPGTPTTPAPPGPDPLFQTGSQDDAERVGIAEIVPQVRSGEVVLLDVRSDAGWATEHAEGAVHIPLQELGVRARELPAGRKIVAYCT